MPYRELPLPPPSAEPADAAAGDDAIGAVLIGIGLVPVIATVAIGGSFGAEPTLGLGLALLGLASRRRRR
jgi:MYXO-CTERM domain-containing protein